jgi:hypothetical protein
MPSSSLLICLPPFLLSSPELHRFPLPGFPDTILRHFSIHSFKVGSPYVAQASLELVVLLPWPSECWDYSTASTRFVLFLLLYQ